MMERYRETMTLTPALARRFLGNRHARQRKLGINEAEKMARDIRNGRWNNEIHFADPLMVTEDGELINGQHRCEAVILAGKPIIVDVEFNVPSEAFEYVDNGKPRSLVQFVKGKNATKVASIARFANAITKGSATSTALTGKVGMVKGSQNSVYASRSELLEYIDAHYEELNFCALQGERLYKAVGGGSRAGMSNALWAILHICPIDEKEHIQLFVDDVASDLPSTMAIASAKTFAMKKLINAKTTATTIRAEWWFSLILTMWDLRNSDRRKISEKDISRTFKMYSALLEERIKP